MKDLLLFKGIIQQSGEISKDKINLVAGAITQPFAAGERSDAYKVYEEIIKENIEYDYLFLFVCPSYF